MKIENIIWIVVWVGVKCVILSYNKRDWNVKSKRTIQNKSNLLKFEGGRIWILRVWMSFFHLDFIQKKFPSDDLDWQIRLNGPTWVWTHWPNNPFANLALSSLELEFWLVYSIENVGHLCSMKPNLFSMLFLLIPELKLCIILKHMKVVWLLSSFIFSMINFYKVYTVLENFMLIWLF